MNRLALADKTNGFLVEVVGEAFHRWTDEDGDIRFAVSFRGVPVGLIAEELGETESVLAGHHVVGTRVENEQAAAEFVARRNQRLRIGRMELCGQDVVFFHHLFGTGVNKDAVRMLLALLAGESLSYADLAAATGALRLSDIVALDQLGES